MFCVVHLLCSRFRSYRDLPLTVGLELEFIEPGRACVSFVLLYWFISHQYTRRNTNSVTHSTVYTIRSMCQSICFVVCSFLSESGILIKMKKWNTKKRNPLVFEEWYLHDLRSPTGNDWENETMSMPCDMTHCRSLLLLMENICFFFFNVFKVPMCIAFSVSIILFMNSIVCSDHSFVYCANDKHTTSYTYQPHRDVSLINRAFFVRS